uniref:Acyltransferase n=1 Tax=Acidobacterium capsulatum TaxID=33075 RepID=A0A7V4XRL6_9BACT
MKTARRSVLPRPSRAMLTWFRLYLRWYVPRHFRAVRLAHAARFEQAAREETGALVVALNHPSWWDPLTCMLVAHALMPEHDHYGPMDAVEAERYGILRRMGLFPVEQHSPRGAAQFLRASQQIFSRPRSVLWMTPQGAFTDVRPRPLTFRAGLSVLAARLPRVTVLPLAVEYAFWNERLPEALVNCGAPEIFSATDESRTVESVDARLAGALTAASDELMQMSVARNAADFETILEGGRGMGSIYSVWQSLAHRRGRHTQT